MKLRPNNKYSKAPNTSHIPITQRRLKTKPALTVMFILLLGNIFSFIVWIWPSSSNDSASVNNEVVATIGETEINKQQWLAEMEKLYGKETLQAMVNEQVMTQAAKQYEIDVTDEEIDLELSLLKSAQDVNDTTTANLTEKQLRQKIRSQLILEKVLTKDIVIEEKQAADYYEENQSIYNTDTAYRTSVIIVQSKEDAEAVQKELKAGSQFAVLARERSLDTASASLGGDIGFIEEGQEGIDESIIEAAAKLKKGETSKPVELTDGRYVIIYVADQLQGQSFSFNEVKEHILRELALEQLASSVTPESFWTEFDVSWFYGESK